MKMTGRKNPDANARRLHMLATQPATRNQVGVIAGELERRLGVRERSERLEVSAALLGLGALGSTRDLTMGEAGALVKILRGTADRADLYRRVADAREKQARAETGGRATAAGIAGSLLRALIGALGNYPR
jgi:hypothetical protein